MTCRAALDEAVHVLRDTETPFLDALVLMAFASGVTKERILGSLPEEITADVMNTFHDLVKKRSEGTPVSYLRGMKEFWGMEFHVDNRVLVPRPDTEILVEVALRIIDHTQASTLLDCCTGTGCIAIAVKSERPNMRVSVSDASADALAVCMDNAARLNIDIAGSYHSDLFHDVPGTFDIITSNPPYLSAEEVNRMASNRWPEPRMALYGGEIGTELPTRLIHNSLDSLDDDGYLIIEAASDQMKWLDQEMRAAGFTSVSVERDLAERDRVILGTTGDAPWSV